MSDIFNPKRYDLFDVSWMYGATMKEDPSGEWVKYHDYSYLLTEILDLQAQLKQLEKEKDRS